MKTVWKFTNKYKADPKEAYKEICSLENITPQNVVDLARNEDSVIHDDFEWDDGVAGERYRCIQAREMIRSFILVKDDPTPKEEDKFVEYEFPESSLVGKLRALHSTSLPHEYAPTEYFLENHDEYQILLNKALAELESFKKRYSMIAELEEVFNAINNL